MSDHRIQVEAITVNYSDLYTHNSDTVLLVHGLGGDHRGLLDCVSVLKNCRIVAVDLPGYGKSQPMTKRHSIDNYADFLESVRQTLGIDRFTLIAHSFGTPIAYMYAKRYPRAVKKLVLLNPVLEINPTLSWRLSRLYAAVAFSLPDRFSRFLLCSRLVVYLSDKAILTKAGKPNHRKILHEDYENYKQLDIRAFRESVQSLNKSSFAGFIHATSTPTLIILGDHDALVKSDSVLNIVRSIKNIQATLLKGGHLLPLENPEIVGRAIHNFIDRQ